MKKNIIVKMFVDDGNTPLYPIPTKSNEKIYKEQFIDNLWILNKDKKKILYPNVIFAGRSGSWSFMDIDEIMDQAQKNISKNKTFKEE